MIIKKELPPNLEQLEKAGLGYDPGKTFLTYGDVIYNAAGNKISPDLLHHEETHSKRQGNDPDKWWGKYLNDTGFRLAEEIEAYREQFKFICKGTKNIDKKLRVLVEIGEILSGKLYGNIISKDEAIKRVREGII